MGGESEDDRGGKGEDDRRGIGMKIANDNPKLSSLLPLCHSCSLSVIPAKAGIQSWLLWRVRRKKQRHWILYLTGSPIKNVGDKRRG